MKTNETKAEQTKPKCKVCNDNGIVIELSDIKEGEYYPAARKETVYRCDCQ